MKRINQIGLVVCMLGLAWACKQPVSNILPEEMAVNQQFNPETYVCYRTAGTISVDGNLNDADWQKAPWTNLFVDIEGSKKPAPAFATRAKMLWDDQYFYVAAEMEEPHVWGTLLQRDTVIFYDNDFEVFIDPDWDTHNYYEFEINALNTVWDLLLAKPYRDQTMAIDSWDIAGLKTAVHIDGTINNPTDTDKGWTVEIAFPLNAMCEAKNGQRPPIDGEQWRVGFSRVEWQTIIENARYIKKKGPNGERIPEDNWVWSATDEIAMHKPELWGVVQFSDNTTDQQNTVYQQNKDWEAICNLRNLYYRQKYYRKQFGEFASSLQALRFDQFNAEITVHRNTYTASVPSVDGQTRWYIREDGKLWQSQ